MQHELKQVEVRLRLTDKTGVFSMERIDTPDKAVSVLAPVLAELDREEVCVVNLDGKGRPINFNVVSIGSVNASLVTGRELYKTAILSNAAGMIMFHINISLREHPEYLEMEGGSCACVMFIRKYPNGLTDQFLNELTNMDFPIIYSMDVEPLDNDVAYQMVMKKYMSNERSINREQELKNENGDYSTNINYERRKQQRDTEEISL